MVCKNIKCRKEFEPKNNNQAYCCRACSPYGHLQGEDLKNNKRRSCICPDNTEDKFDESFIM